MKSSMKLTSVFLLLFLLTSCKEDIVALSQGNYKDYSFDNVVPEIVDKIPDGYICIRILLE